MNEDKILLNVQENRTVVLVDEEWRSHSVDEHKSMAEKPTELYNVY